MVCRTAPAANAGAGIMAAPTAVASAITLRRFIEAPPCSQSRPASLQPLPCGPLGTNVPDSNHAAAADLADTPTGGAGQVEQVVSAGQDVVLAHQPDWPARPPARAPRRTPSSGHRTPPTRRG